MEQALLQCLYQTLDSNPAARQAAEAQLQAASAEGGYGVALARISLERELPFGIRQLAAVVLKQYVKYHWTPASKHFIAPVCGEGDKAAIRSLLPDGLRDEVPKIHTNSSPVITGLLMFFCRLVHMNANELLEFLASRPSPVASAAQEGDTALGFVMRLWIERQVEIQGQLNIKLSTTALALLLTSRHPSLASVTVKGRRLDTGGAIRTRSRARVQAEQWSSVPIPVKLVEMLSDALIEAQEQTANAGGGDEDYGDEDDDWEEEGSAGKGFGMDLFQFLSNRAEEEPVLDDEDAKADPIYNIDLPTFIAEKLRFSLGGDSALKEAAWQHLTALQQAAVQHSLNST